MSTSNFEQNPRDIDILFTTHAFLKTQLLFPNCIELTQACSDLEELYVDGQACARDLVSWAVHMLLWLNRLPHNETVQIHLRLVGRFIMAYYALRHAI
jgi:hypothetical protein